MAVKQLLLPANRAFNSDGVPEAGAQAFLYLSGSSTPADFYSDSGRTVSLGHFITANAAGRFTPMPYGDDSVAYRLVIQDSNGATLDDIDPFYFGSCVGGLNDIGLRADLAANTGATLVGVKSAGTGAVARTVAAKSADLISVKDFGAKGDANSTGSTGTDDTSAIQAALNYIGTLGGGTLYFPEGNYKVTSYLTVPNDVTIRGAGQKATNIVGTHAGGGGANPAENARNGSILYNAQTINTSGGANLVIENIRLFNSNASNQGAGFYQQSGVIVTLRNVECGGSKWGVILDQSEDVTIDSCILASNVAGGAALWIVNGPGLNPSAQSGFSNIIVVRDSELNVITTSYGIIDDGGYAHTFDSCNFVCGINGVRASGVNGLTISNYYFEEQTADCVVIAATTFGGTASSGCIATLTGGWATRPTNKALVKGLGSSGQLHVIGAYSNDSGSPLIQGAGTFYRIVVSAAVPGDPALLDADASNHTLNLTKLYADSAGHVGVPSNGTNGGARLTPSSSSGFVEVFNPSGARQGYFGFLTGTALQFGVDGTATSFQFLAPLSGTGAITSSGGGVGYATGAGGTVTQATSRTTGVTLNTNCGQITLFSVAGSATWQTFTVTNSKVAATDVIRLSQASGTDKYMLHVTGVRAGAFDVTFATTGGTTVEQPVINFAVIKAVNA